MSKNLITIKIQQIDKKAMMKECKELFLQHHPELRGMKISINFMFNKLVEYYLNN